MKIANFFLPLILLSALTGCSVYNNVYSDYDRSVDFNGYKTFAWLPDSGVVMKKDTINNTLYDNDIIRNNAKNYINHYLGEIGYIIQTDTPDVLVQLVLLNEKKERIVTYPSYFYSPYYYHNHYYYPYYYPYYDHYTYYGWGWDNYYYGYSTYKESYIKGTIIINMFDRKLKKRVWTGSAEGDIYDPYYVQYDVHPAIRDIIKSFPIKPLDKKKNQKNGNNTLYSINKSAGR